MKKLELSKSRRAILRDVSPSTCRAIRFRNVVYDVYSPLEIIPQDLSIVREEGTLRECLEAEIAAQSQRQKTTAISWGSSSRLQFHHFRAEGTHFLYTLFQPSRCLLCHK